MNPEGRLVDDAYIAAVSALVEDLRAWLAVTPRAPRFRMAPVGMMIVAPISALKAICANPEAVDCVDHLVRVTAARSGPEHEPTVFMLSVVLEHLGIPVERVSLTKLGLKVGAG